MCRIECVNARLATVRAFLPTLPRFDRREEVVGFVDVNSLARSVDVWELRVGQ